MKNHLFYPLMLTLALGMSACRADVDLANIDPSMKLDFGLALPVGEVSASIGDLLGGTNFGLGVREDGTFYLHDSVSLPLDQNLDIPLPNLKDQFAPIQQDIDLLSQFNIGTFNYHAVFDYPTQYGMLHVDRNVPVQFNSDLALHISFDTTAVIMGFSQSLHVDTTLELNEVPVPVSALPTREISSTFSLDITSFNNHNGLRVDSILVSNAAFKTRFTLSNVDMSIMQVEYINVSFDPKAFHRTNSTITLPLDGANFGQDILAEMGRFNLCLMANPNATPSSSNILSEAEVTMKMVLNCEPTDTIRIRKNPKFSFRCEMVDLSWDAIYGLFSLDSPITYDSEVSILSQFGESLAGLKEVTFPLAEPRLSLITRSQLGMPLSLSFNEIAMHDTVSNLVAKAEWNGQNTYTWVTPNFVKGNDPLDAFAISTFTLSSKAEEGSINRLFAVRPDKLSFSFAANVCTDPAYATQHRITPSPQFELSAVYDLPFSFGPGLNLAYRDTFPGINLSGISLDSLLREVQMIDSVQAHVKAIIHVENMLPFNLNCKLAFLDQNNHEVKLQAESLGNIQIIKPTGYDKATGRFTQPGTSVIVLDLTENDLEKLQDANALYMDLSISDIDQQRQELESYPLLLTQRDYLKVKVALAADASAYIKATLNGKEN